MNLKKLKKNLNNQIEQVLTKLEVEYEIFNDNIYSICPVHDDSDNPRAFSFSLEKGIWKCWTRDCQNSYHNDIFGLIRGTLSKRSGREVNFSEVLKWVCKEFNIDKSNYHKPVNEVIHEDDDFSTLIKNLGQLRRHTNHTQKVIDNPYVINVPSEYFFDRGFKKSTLKYFEVGDCYEKGIMKERSVIPIHNDVGDSLVGLIGRSIKEYRMPKFLIYPSGFNKRNYFYNYHRCVETASKTHCLYIVEGQGDVWRLHEAGVKNAVSLFGKTVSKEQELKIKKLPITHLVVIMDNDQAGREARVQIQRQFARMYKLTFPQLKEKDVGEMSTYKIKKDLLENLRGTY